LQSEADWQGPPDAECPVGPQTPVGSEPSALIWQPGSVGASPEDVLDALEEPDPLLAEAVELDAPPVPVVVDPPPEDDDAADPLVAAVLEVMVQLAVLPGLQPIPQSAE
jgi:hypothetical protein